MKPRHGRGRILCGSFSTRTYGWRVSLSPATITIIETNTDGVAVARGRRTSVGGQTVFRTLQTGVPGVQRRHTVRRHARRRWRVDWPPGPPTSQEQLQSAGNVRDAGQPCGTRHNAVDHARDLPAADIFACRRQAARRQRYRTRSLLCLPCTTTEGFAYPNPIHTTLTTLWPKRKFIFHV